MIPTYATDTPVTNRPLNTYVANAVNVFACPSDKGDPINAGVTSCFEQYGNSYLIEFSMDAYGVKKVTDRSTGTPIKDSDVALRPSTKIILGDWIWHFNRSVQIPEGAWHNDKGQRRLSMLFGDAHAEVFKLDIASVPVGQTPSVDFNWW